ncbi:hypothetical protein NQ318_008488 [Aromia moschata]|uniref:DUF7819 domain-containing protein n=1 Tax=Aromia moschata TaxID=1265417 RepID=A0AAV8X780_9CUCU|nr:hypothetical protein NQ318_008488 [Aromia moschata]
MFPDFSKPPPGFPSKLEPFMEELLPTAPYYDLPAGLMVPLIKLEETSYKPLDPKDIRLPPPAPPSDRLLAAVDAFYSLPSHDRPRDSEGWEKLGLYEYYKAKNIAKKKKKTSLPQDLDRSLEVQLQLVCNLKKNPHRPREGIAASHQLPHPHLIELVNDPEVGQGHDREVDQEVPGEGIEVAGNQGRVEKVGDVGAHQGQGLGRPSEDPCLHLLLVLQKSE